MSCSSLPPATDIKGYLCCQCGVSRTPNNLARCPNPTCAHGGLNWPLYIGPIIELDPSDEAPKSCRGCLKERYIDRRAWMCWSCERVNLAKHGQRCQRCGYILDGACLVGWTRLTWRDGPQHWAVTRGQYGGSRWRTTDD